MDIQIIPATPDHVPQICDCGRRAFSNDGLQSALFPARLRDAANPDPAYEAAKERIPKQMKEPGARFIVAMQDSAEGNPRVVGYVLYFTPVAEGDGAEPEKPGGPQAEQPFPKSMDVAAYNLANKVIEKAKKEILGENKKDVWYLRSLAIDPDHQGKGIASRLVKWGMYEAEKAGFPIYLESTPAAVGFYRRLGFQEYRRLKVIANDDDHYLTVFTTLKKAVE